MADQGSASQVQLENTTEHVLHINVEGSIISVPPKEQGAQTVNFADSDEREKFERALQTETVSGWIKNGELVVHGKGALTPEQLAAAQQGSGQQQGGQQPNQPQTHSATAPSTSDTTPEVGRTSRTRGNRE